MKGIKAVTVLAALLVSTSANAVKVPLPEAIAANGSTLNVSFQLQPWALFTENGAPDGTAMSADFYVRRARRIGNTTGRPPRAEAARCLPKPSAGKAVPGR